MLNWLRSLPLFQSPRRRPYVKAAVCKRTVPYRLFLEELEARVTPSNNGTVHLTDSTATIVEETHYAAKTDVYAYGNGLVDGYYDVEVVAPGGKSPSAPADKILGLSDPNYPIQVIGGHFVSGGPSSAVLPVTVTGARGFAFNVWDEVISTGNTDGNPPTGSTGYDDTENNGGEYQVVIAQHVNGEKADQELAQFSGNNSETKSKNFKVDQVLPTGTLTNTNFILTQPGGTQITGPNDGGTSAAVGSTAVDSAGVVDSNNMPVNEGTVTFAFYSGDSPSGSIIDTSDPIAVVNGIATDPTTEVVGGLGAGDYYFTAAYSGVSGTLDPSTSDPEPFTIVKANPTISTSPFIVVNGVNTPTTTIDLGTTVPPPLEDAATLSGGYNETGTITFTLHYLGTLAHPTDTVVDTETGTPAVNGDGTYTTPTGYTLPSNGTTVVGSYQWDATFTDTDGNNNTAADINNTNEQVQVIGPSAGAFGTTPNPTTVTLSTTAPTLTDSATLTGDYFPTGTITFTLYSPSNALLYTDVVSVSGNGTYNTDTLGTPAGGNTLATIGKVTGTYQWDATFTDTDGNNSSPTDHNNPNETVVVSPAQPTLTTTSSGNIQLGTTAPTITDTADLEGAYYPTGSINFTLTLNGNPVPGFSVTDTVTHNGTPYYSASYPLPTTGTVAGIYVWQAVYTSGDGNNLTANDSTSTTAETLTVSKASPTIVTTPSPFGLIVLDNDEWTLSDVGFSADPTSATNYAINIANEFAPGGHGSFLVYSNNFGLTGSSLASTITTDTTDSWTVSTSVPFTLAGLSSYNAVFLAGYVGSYSTSVLTQYAEAGGNVFIAGGTATIGDGSAAAEAATWNPFLVQFGLSFASSYNGIVGSIPISSSNALFSGVTSLYEDNGSDVELVGPLPNPPPQILITQGSDGLYATGQTSSAITLGTTAPTLDDSITMSGAYNPTGTINVTLTLNGVPIASGYTTSYPAANGTVTDYYTLPKTGTVAGTYDWSVSYAGDANNNAAADGIPVFDTGVDNSGTPLADGSVDPHWQLVASADSANPAPGSSYVVDQGFYPLVSGPWIADSATSKWIAPQADESGGEPAGNYDYETTFNLNGFDPSTAQLTGRFTSDNEVSDVLINGHSTGINDGSSDVGQYHNWYSFTISSGFQPGINTLEFITNNDGGPTGFRVELSGTAAEQTVVSPASPTISTQASATGLISGALGTAAPKLSDRATLVGAYYTTGTVTFTLVGPNGFSYSSGAVPLTGTATPGTYTASASDTLPITGQVAGTYTWSVSYSGDGNNNPTSETGNSSNGEQTVVSPASPKIVTTANPNGTIYAGTTAPTLTDSAVLSGGYYEKGSITFTLTGPGGYTYTQTNTMVNGNATYTASNATHLESALGTYTWTVTYSGDVNNNPYTETGNATNGEQVTIQDQVAPNETATLGFWANNNGQALLKTYTATGTASLGYWLSSNYPNLFGNLGSDTGPQVAAYFLLVKANVGGLIGNTYAQALTTALGVWVTTSGLGYDAASQAQGFTHGFGGVGLGSIFYNVGSNGASFGVPNNTYMTVSYYLSWLNSETARGKNATVGTNNSTGGGTTTTLPTYLWFYSSTDTTLTNGANNVFNGINEGGDI